MSQAYEALTPAERREWGDGYYEGEGTSEGDANPYHADEPIGAGWLEGHREAHRLASAAADMAEAEIDAALAPVPAPRVRLADYYAPAEPDGGGPECWPPMHVLLGGRA